MRSIAVTDLSLPAGARLEDLLPTATPLVLVGLLYPGEMYLLSGRRNPGFYRIVRELDAISNEIATNLEADGFSSVAIPAYFPARVRGETICGIIPLKDCAEQACLDGKDEILFCPSQIREQSRTPGGCFYRTD